MGYITAIDCRFDLFYWRENMVDLSPQEEKIVNAMKDIGAVDESHVKSADQIGDKANLPKGLVTNLLTNLCNKKVIKRLAREKAAGYYVMPQ
ncbi:MAG: transcriptional regulator [Candidatus Diapherotrites archaeon]|nr:transcriptional regulator [Candidatus Diapherotrites archaeon]